MLGRRSHVRLSLESGAEGVLSLSRDVAVRVRGDGQLVAISREAAVTGERVRVMLHDDAVDVLADVVESRPIIHDGAVRFQLLLRCHPRDADAINSDRMSEPTR